MPPASNLRNSTRKLAIAGSVEYGLQIFIPIILVRQLDTTTFAEYRFLWLLAGTAVAIAPLYLPQSLFYFLPRSQNEKKRQVVTNIFLLLCLTGISTLIITLGWNPLLPTLARDLFFKTHGLSSVFLGLWVVATIFDSLPTADGRASWQSAGTIITAIFRTLLLACAAFFTENIAWLVGALVVTATVKLGLFSYYLNTHHKKTKKYWPPDKTREILIYSIPFAISNAFFLFRLQADQWIVSSMLSIEVYAIFSISTVFLPIANLIRQPINNALLPQLNSAYSRGDFSEIENLIMKGSKASSLLLLPIIGALISLAPQLVRIIYTEKYEQAAPIMQIYLVGMIATTFATGHVLSAIEKKRESVLISALTLCVSITLGIACVYYFGAPGGAMGSVLTLLLGELLSLAVIAKALGSRISRLLPWDTFVPTLIAATAATILTYIFEQFFLSTAIILLFTKTAIYTISFLLFFLLAGGKRHIMPLIKSDKIILKRIGA